MPQGAKRRVTGDEVHYNSIALDIMRRHGIPVNDLYAFALPRLAALQKSADVHFTDAGSEALAGEVARAVLAALG